VTERPPTPELPESEPSALECLDLRKAFGDVTAVGGVSLTVRHGELLALLGPSGCGKTTTLRLIAGFESADGGSVRVGGRLVLDAGLSLPPESRRVGMVFQDYALFPHLTVAQNVGYGLERPGIGRPGVAALLRWARRHLPAPSALAEEAEVREALALVELGHLAGRYPHELSGGEAQRVALARALAPRPDLILLDEPFSNLDTRLRAAVRAEVRAILKRAGAAAVFVTHDQEEAFSLADRVAVMWEGRVAQIGTPSEIYGQPASREVAKFVGDADFLPGVATTDTVLTELGNFAVAGGNVGGAVDVMLRPEALSVRAEGDSPGPDGPGAGAVGEVIDHEYYGHDQMIAVRLTTGRVLHARLGPSGSYRVGDRVRILAPSWAVTFPARDGGSAGTDARARS
jgi:iron(III) transport system ATP-binding protein